MLINFLMKYQHAIAEVAPAAAAPAAAAATKKAAAKKPAGAKKVAHAPAEHPKYSEMIKQALASLKERGGSSRQAVLKYIMANFKVGKDEASVNSHLKMALKAGVKNNSLKQSKGTGAAGSFRLGAEAKKEKKAQAAKTTKKKKAAKSTGTGKKSKAKKSES